MIEKGKLPVAVVSFDLKNPHNGSKYRYRSPMIDLEPKDIVLVNCKTGLQLAVVTQIDWVEPPIHAERKNDSNCVIAFVDPNRLLQSSLRLQLELYEGALSFRAQRQQRKEEIEITIRALQQEILELVKELDTL